MIDLLERKAELTQIRALARRGGTAVIEGGAGLGKTALIDAACTAASRGRRLVLRTRGSELERDFALGAARHLFERHCAETTREERTALFAGPARAARALLASANARQVDVDASFAMLHGLYWLTLNLAAARGPLLIAVDDAHWADDASLRWLAYLAPRLQQPEMALIVALRPDEVRSQMRELAAVRAAANATMRPALLSRPSVGAIVRVALGSRVDDAACTAIHCATGGNPFYLHELLRTREQLGPRFATPVLTGAQAGVEGIALRLGARLRALDPACLQLAKAIVVLGDDCELRHAALISEIEMASAARFAAELVRLEVLGQDRPPRFLHPIVRQAIAQTLSNAEQDAAHRAAARMLHAEHAPPGLIAAHLLKLPGAGDPWIVERLREAARTALNHGAPAAAAELFDRALTEPPPPHCRVEVLREAARAQQQAGRANGCELLEQALAVAEGAITRAELAAQLAQAHAALFNWSDAADVLEGALAALGDVAPAVAARLQCQLVVVGLQDARVAPRALQAMQHLRLCCPSGTPAQALRIAEGMVAVLTGRPVTEAATLLDAALASAGPDGDDWDLQAALWWSAIAAERFDAVRRALQAAMARVQRSGSARGLVAVYSSLGLLKLRLGALPEADAAARIALRVLQEGDFKPGLAFAATVLADIAIAGGELNEAQALLDLLPQAQLAAGVGTVLIPAARGRLRLAQGRAHEALVEFEACMALWHPDVWGIDVRDSGYVHARSGAAQALLCLGEVRRASELAEAELADVRRFAAPRALGVALRAAGLARGGGGLEALEESAAVLAASPAALERAASLVEWGAALRRAGRTKDARTVLAQGLDLAARCAAWPLAARAREELRIAGARPRRDWSVGVEALTASEIRIAELARGGRSNREIAQQLYLSIKTVEGHLARAYGKLGVAGRGELEQALRSDKARVSTR